MWPYRSTRLAVQAIMTYRQTVLHSGYRNDDVPYRNPIATMPVKQFLGSTFMCAVTIERSLKPECTLYTDTIRHDMMTWKE